MKLRGVLEMEGIRLHLNVELQDGECNIYLAKVHPNCVVIPKERWPVDLLGLPPDCVRALKSRKVKSLSELVDESWNLVIGGFSEKTQQDIEACVHRFKSLALIFDQEPLDVVKVETHVFVDESPHAPKQAEDSALKDPAPAQPYREPEAISIDEFGLSKEETELLRSYHEIETVADVHKRGQARIVMTPGFTHKGVSQLLEGLQRVGYPFNRKHKEPLEETVEIGEFL